MSDPRGHFIGGEWTPGDGQPFSSTDPATGHVNWEGRAATDAEVDRAITAARLAFSAWSGASFDARAELATAGRNHFSFRARDLADAITRETGKPRWEAKTEVEVMVAKAGISADAYRERCGAFEKEVGGVRTVRRFRAHGVVGVFGPFNFPGHLPNGHILPALLAGNAVVFKPSEQTPLVGQIMGEIWAAALAYLDLPLGLFNLVQGGRDTGAALARHRGIDGLFFTGSAAGGIALNRALADHPEKILALEMGGNNPLIVHGVSDLRAAAYVTVQSAFITAGQRCSCARRLIVCDGPETDAFIRQLIEMIGRLRVGLPDDDPEPFLGPVISAAAARALLDAQADLITHGARPLVEMKSSPRSPALLTPGLLDVTNVKHRQDTEFFGPLLQLIRVPDFDAALAEANATRYGLAAGLISDSRDLYDRFSARIRAGVVNWNRPLTGASSHLPFGGIGLSGNHRPSAYFAADYCSYPVASLESEHPTIPAQGVPGISL